METASLISFPDPAVSQKSGNESTGKNSVRETTKRARQLSQLDSTNLSQVLLQCREIVTNLKGNTQLDIETIKTDLGLASIEIDQECIVYGVPERVLSSPTLNMRFESSLICQFLKENHADLHYLILLILLNHLQTISVKQETSLLARRLSFIHALIIATNQLREHKIDKDKYQEIVKEAYRNLAGTNYACSEIIFSICLFNNESDNKVTNNPVMDITLPELFKENSEAAEILDELKQK